AAAAGDVTESLGEEGLADADGADDRDVGVGFEEAQRDQLVEERLVEGHLGGGIPGLELHGRIELGALGAERGGLAVAARDLVAQDQEQEVGGRDLLLAGEGDAFRQAVEQARELEAAQYGAQIGREGVGGHESTSPFGSGWVKGRAY